MRTQRFQKVLPALLPAITLVALLVAPAMNAMITGRDGATGVATTGVGHPVPAKAVQRSAPGEAWRWPLDGDPTVVRPFDPPAQPWLPGHRGVDLAAPPGAVVRAAGAGVVRFSGLIAGRTVISVEHSGGLVTTYEPVTAPAPAGTTITTGQQIGLLSAGHEGCPAIACLHWGLRDGSGYLDPLSLLGHGRVRLLPRG